ncbi:MAG TPA: M56 family metallopeptidase [Verrucomicrobiae bacterium]|nr:M56 family metallopeptidase [Verrucomicrobiae bacterium]
MNSNIESLNEWGGRFLEFAWPMLWQSSLLIAFVFALDLLSARKIRAAVRYALWLTVLVKLLLPPTLALPTGAAWWLCGPKPQAPVIKSYAVTYGAAAQPPDVSQSVPLVAPKPALKRAGQTLLASVTVSAGLLMWLAFRWWRVTRTVGCVAASERFAGELAAARRLAGVRSTVRLKLAEGRMSPAVCGLIRPIILLPRTLADTLSSGQLRAVLLHELFHLRRKDVWVNCAQALLQIVYWWHPVLWLANSRIRRVREEAVDDAVMLALRHERDVYAPTLLEVARHALRRPLLSLGLVGIMESRSALRRRIERLVSFRAPRKTGLTFLSLAGIFAFSAVALPMGQAPATAPDSFSPDAAAVEKTLTVKVDPAVLIRNVKAQADWTVGTATNDYTEILLHILSREGVNCNPPHGIAFNTRTGEMTMQNVPDQLEAFREVIEQLNRADGKCELPLRNSPIHRQSILIKTRFIWMRSGDFQRLIQGLQAYRGRQWNTPWWSVAPDKIGEFNQTVNLLGLKPIVAPRAVTLSGMEAEFYVGTMTNGVKNGVDICCEPVVIDGGVQLAFKTEVVGNPEGRNQILVGTNRYQVHGMVAAEDRGAIVIRAENPDGSPTNLVMVIGLQVVTNGESLPFQKKLSNGTVEGVAQGADRFPPQIEIHMKARFIEVPKDSIVALTSQVHQLTGILADKNMKTILRALESRPGVTELAEPNVLTISGRQTELRATQIQQILTNYDLQEISNKTAVVAQTGKIETGPVVDLVPVLLSDGYTVDLKAAASLTRFLGYDEPTNQLYAYDKAGEKIRLPTVLPALCVQKASAELKIADGQTVVLKLQKQFYESGTELSAEPEYFMKDKTGADEEDKEVLVFITVTLVDSAGNRIHTDDVNTLMLP